MTLDEALETLGIQPHELAPTPLDEERGATIVASAETLRGRLRSERIAGVVRHPAETFGGESSLEMIRNGCEREVLNAVRRRFDVGGTA